MTNSQKHCSQDQISAWIRGLQSIALADNDFSDKEKELIHELSHALNHEPSYSEQLQGKQLRGEMSLTELENSIEVGSQPISPAELADAFGADADLAQNFLRTAVMVAMADGDYSEPEDDLIHQFSGALKQEIQPMLEVKQKVAALTRHEHHENQELADLLHPLKEWLDRLEIHDPRIAKFLCKAIPSQCPFERDVFLFGRKLMHIPAMCQINPLYDQLIGLRFRSLSFLADECGEDVSEFC